jgi:hypothetical protein
MQLGLNTASMVISEMQFGDTTHTVVRAQVGGYVLPPDLDFDADVSTLSWTMQDGVPPKYSVFKDPTGT